MKRITQFFFIFLVVGFILPNLINAQFQPAPVEKSKQKIINHGKVYYIHTIKPNQTLYSISRAYGVTVQDIAAANPNVLLEVISEGETLQIPSITPLENLSESYFGLSEKDFYYHTVKPQQTVHFLSKKYNVTKEDIYYYNLGTEDVIQVGQIIKIPKPHVISQQKKIIDIDTSNTYVVKLGDTLYSLSKRYGVSIAELIEINPQLRWGLQPGMRLNLSPDGQFSAFKPILDTLKYRGVSKINLYIPEKCDSLKNIYSSETIKIALMLPFHASELLALDTIVNDSARRNHPNFKFRSRGISFAEFYEGFLIAIDSLKETGAQITLFTYDTKSDTTQVDNILKELDIVRPNIIYGPILPDNIKRVSVYSERNKTPLILPLVNNKQNYTNGNPFAISLMPDVTTEINQCSDYLSQFHDKNIILIHDEDSAGATRIDNFRETLFSYFSSKAAYEEALYKEIRVNDEIQQNLEHALRENTDNIVLVVSTEEAYVSNIIGLLRINQSLGYSIDLFGLAVWQSFDNLRIELLHQLNTVLYSPFYIDYNNQHTLNFVKKCRSKLGYEPYKTVNTGSGFNFTYLGYEAGLLFTEAFEQYGPEFLNCICNLEGNMPESQYKFEWDKDGGFSNTNINFVNYTSDFEVKLIEFESLKMMNETIHEQEMDVNPFINQ